jgi:plastocyanin
MRTFLVALAICGVYAATASGVATVDVRGIARAKDRVLSNAVVWLEARGAPPTPANRRIVLDQRNLTFYPHVLAIRAGTTVDFPNSDRVFHNVFSFRDGKRFDLGTYPVGTMRPVTFDRPGVSRLFCNIHPNMAAYVVVLDTPYFSVTDKSGRFDIPDVPAGSYTVGAWRAGGEPLTRMFNTDDETPLEIRWP